MEKLMRKFIYELKGRYPLKKVGKKNRQGSKKKAAVR